MTSSGICGIVLEPHIVGIYLSEVIPPTVASLELRQVPEKCMQLSKPAESSIALRMAM